MEDHGRCDMGIARFKAYDWGVVALFVLIIIGVSLSWYTISLSVAEENLGSMGFSGWDFSLGVMSFVFALIALGWVGLKAVIAPRGPYPFWYLEGVVLMVIGFLIAVFALIRILDKPGGNEFYGIGIGRGAGVFITLIAGVLIAGCGYLAHTDETMAFEDVPDERSDYPIYGPADSKGIRHCKNCGERVEGTSRYCRSCGKPL